MLNKHQKNTLLSSILRKKKCWHLNTIPGKKIEIMMYEVNILTIDYNAIYLFSTLDYILWLFSKANLHLLSKYIFYLECTCLPCNFKPQMT